jgi:Amt family ammonium transporter
VLGAVLTGVFAQKALNEAGKDGALYGNVAQLGTQIVGVVAVAAYSAAVTWVLLKVVDKAIGLRVPVNDEREGLDATEHGETGYAS